MVYASPISSASRTARALMERGGAKLQLYVDGPALSLMVTRDWALMKGSIPILWWLVLGLKLSWSKGYFGDGPHDWIGVYYVIGADGPGMELPLTYLEQTMEQLRPLCAARGSLPVKQVQRLWETRHAQVTSYPMHRRAYIRYRVATQREHDRHRRDAREPQNISSPPADLPWQRRVSALC